MSKQVGIALLGTGTVGGGVIELLEQNREIILKRSEVAIDIIAACARDLDRAQAKLGSEIFVTSNWQEAIAKADIVVELIGGETTAKEIALAAIAAGKPLVTANKALLASHGEEIFAAARANSTPVLFEAAVAGCIPAIRVLQHSLASDQINAIKGIVNGTCNYILTKMHADGIDFEQALALASELGYAEADPSLDVDGFDAAHKAVIMSWLAFGTPLTMASIKVSGVRAAQLIDEKYAQIFGYTIKLIAMVKQHADGIETWVNMALVNNASKLAGVNDNLNALLFDTKACGELLLEGAGAGALPTAAAVVSDIIEAGSKQAVLPAPSNGSSGLEFGKIARESYLRLRVTDSKGVMAKITSELARADISIESMHQGESHTGEQTDIALLLHAAPWESITAVLDNLAKLEEVIDQPVLLPLATPYDSD